MRYFCLELEGGEYAIAFRNQETMFWSRGYGANTLDDCSLELCTFVLRYAPGNIPVNLCTNLDGPFPFPVRRIFRPKSVKVKPDTPLARVWAWEPGLTAYDGVVYCPQCTPPKDSSAENFLTDNYCYGCGVSSDKSLPITQ